MVQSEDVDVEFINGDYVLRTRTRLPLDQKSIVKSFLSNLAFNCPLPQKMKNVPR